MKPNGHHTEDSLIEFPCDFVIKVMGKTEGEFEKIALDIVKKHFPETHDANIQKKLSKDQNYLSLSIMIHVESKMKLDALYRELTRRKEILMVL